MCRCLVVENSLIGETQSSSKKASDSPLERHDLVKMFELWIRNLRESWQTLFCPSLEFDPRSHSYSSVWLSNAALPPSLSLFSSFCIGNGKTGREHCCPSTANDSNGQRGRPV